MCDLLEEAAGEIERLRHILSELNVTPDVAERLTYYQVLAEDRAEMLDEAAAEITRLRAEVAELRTLQATVAQWEGRLVFIEYDGTFREPTTRDI